jgi:hypothetical protein
MDMSNIKIAAIVLLVIGIALLLVSASADIVGLGASPARFGYRQMAGVLVGGIGAVVGAVLYWWSGRE